MGEIDIMEFVGFDPGVVHANIHTRKYNHVQKTGKGSQIKIADALEKIPKPTPPHADSAEDSHQTAVQE